MKTLPARAAICAAAVLLFGCQAEPQTPAPTPPSETAAAPAAEAEPANTVPLTVRTEAGDHEFHVELAVTPEEQRRGLMFREALPENGGMLFPFDYPRYASFWMRNTIIPLDMIFIRADGRITNIARMTTPYSLDTQMSTEPVVAVLEIAGGRAEALGIGDGDRVSWEGGPPLEE